MKEVQSLLENIQIKDNESYLNNECEVLLENKVENQEKYFGRTKFMTPVIFESTKSTPGELKNIKFMDFNKTSLFASDIINNKMKVA